MYSFYFFNLFVPPSSFTSLSSSTSPIPFNPDSLPDILSVLISPSLFFYLLLLLVLSLSLLLYLFHLLPLPLSHSPPSLSILHSSPLHLSPITRTRPYPDEASSGYILKPRNYTERRHVCIVHILYLSKRSTNRELLVSSRVYQSKA